MAAAQLQHQNDEPTLLGSEDARSLAIASMSEQPGLQPASHFFWG
eukprot:CAMPEP_0195029196 /NCGR_PEP_ID=MMETSP0326_2-20130528/56113_1 /TAXON_ID=2866 ORGANISM="Crypthecodinium cohnii, Strain Seligo" /NCGR_SAMPLE_ID=MMETSP0326_2 /ASSEMBLY_ACC=CAM_ASM_000348 /LENGTH=44 /DNA_ID= /DNA_START= /DNA_END= /DNA_ORIENTATION=